MRLPEPARDYDRADQAQLRKTIEREFISPTGTGVYVKQTNAKIITPSLTKPTVDTGTLRVTTATVLGTSGTVSLDPTLGEVFTMVPTGAVTLNAASAAVGTRVYLIITTSGVNSFNVTLGTNFKSQGVLATGVVSGKVFALEFVGDGTNLNEIGARGVAM